jgi:glycosyltransferase involved in cell wall biosynthesis
MKIKPKIGIAPRLSGLGGMVSFQSKFVRSLEARGVEYSFDLQDADLSAMLLIGGPRSAMQFGNSKRADIPIAQRLDGINWLHRKTRTGWRHWLRAEINNGMLRRVRNSVAKRVIYQSHFIQAWWHQKHGPSSGREYIIHNGVDLDHFSPAKKKGNDSTKIEILMVEGNIDGGYELGLKSAIELANYLIARKGAKVSLRVAGKVSEAIKNSSQIQGGDEIEWLGVVPNPDLPEYYRAADMLFSADLNAACPNAVIEALACGLPVVAFNTGALGEMLDAKSGALADYGGDPWELDAADIPALGAAALRIKDDQAHYRQGARARAEEVFDLEQMTDKYLEVLIPDGE